MKDIRDTDQVEPEGQEPRPRPLPAPPSPAPPPLDRGTSMPERTRIILWAVVCLVVGGAVAFIVSALR